MKEKPLPKIETLGQLTAAMFKNELTRHNIVGFVTGLNRRIDNPDSYVSHIYKGKFSELEKGMCNKAYNYPPNGFSIFRNNVTKGICKTCLKNTLKDLLTNQLT